MEWDRARRARAGGQGSKVKNFGPNSINCRFHARISGMRHPRQLEEGARYHVTARANRREMILAPKAIKELFLSVVKRAKTKYGFRLENFCIMNNHIHFVIQPNKGESLSAIMRWILSVFARAYNKLMGYWGHVWGSRFYSRIIASLRELLQVFEYVDNNPVKAGQTANRHNWRWGGLWHDRTRCRDIAETREPWLRQLLSGHEPLLLSYTPAP